MFKARSFGALGRPQPSLRKRLGQQGRQGNGCHYVATAVTALSTWPTRAEALSLNTP